METVKEKLKELWNEVVDGFETAVWNVLVIGSGLAMYIEAVPGLDQTVGKFGPYVSALGIIGLTCRFLLNLSFIQKFKPEGE